MSAALGVAAGAGGAGILVAGMWLWQRYGLTVWLEMGLAWCM